MPIMIEQRSLAIEATAIARASVCRLTPSQMMPERTKYLFICLYSAAFVEDGSYSNALAGAT